MMLDFLTTYAEAVSLDHPKFASRFPTAKNKADFLLFQNRVVCEVKDKRKTDIPRQVERVWRKGDLSTRDVARDVSRSIIADLHDGARQIQHTREVLGLPDTLGLVIIENHIPQHLSTAVLIAAADSEMQRALPEIDAVLCLDFVNTFNRSPIDSIRLAQLVCRRTKRSEELNDLMETRLFSDFSMHAGIPICSGHRIEKLHQTWVTDQQGRFKTYKAQIDLIKLETRASTWRRILRFVARWSWVLGLAWVLLDLLIRRIYWRWVVG